MGEVLETASVRDRWRIHRDGALVFADQLTVAGPVHDLLARTAPNMGAMASIVMVSPRAETLLEVVRADLAEAIAAADLIRPGVLFLRVFAKDAFHLRKTLLPTLSTMTGQPVPVPWMI